VATLNALGKKRTFHVNNEMVENIAKRPKQIECSQTFFDISKACFK
jgi:hypothetical protein